MAADSDLRDRYGAPAPWRRLAVVGACVVLVAAFVGWLGWTIWSQATPEVESDLVGYSIAGEHAAKATVEVRIDDDAVDPTCTLRAYAEDHTVVGELSFTPSRDGRVEETVRTERRATSVDLVGCTSAGQERPR